LRNMNPNPDTPKPTATFHVDMWDWGYYNNCPEEYGKSFFWESFYLPAEDTDRYWRDGRLIRWVMEIELPADHHEQDHDAEDFDPDAWCEVVWEACGEALKRVGFDFEASALPGPDIQEVVA
jgi:hypothetical protein